MAEINVFLIFTIQPFTFYCYGSVHVYSLPFYMKECKILIVDDDEDDIGLLAGAFLQSGVENLHYVFSAMQAFIYLESVQHACLPKLIITDHFLPGMTGTEFLKDLKAMEKYRHIHVVVLSTIKSPKEIEKHRQMGALDYLNKPCTYEEYRQVAAEIKRKVGL